MSAVQDAMKQRQRGFRRLVRWPWCWPLLAMPAPVIAYVLSVVTGYLALAAWELARTSAGTYDLVLFGMLVACGALCIEATRRLGHPSGISRDLLSAWWLPVALLLPPACAMVAPAILGTLLYLRVGGRAPVYRRVFSSAALGLAGTAASTVFRLLTPGATAPGATAAGQGLSGWLTYPGSHAWFTRPQATAAAIGCALGFSVLNTCLVAVAARLAEPDVRLADQLWDRERMLLDLTEICAGILVTIACALSPLLLCVALPPVMLLQRSLMHAQLKAAARTDAKTGLLNAAAWQREADAEIARAQRHGECLAVLLADVDHFKQINDTHGHLIGDRLLRALAGEFQRQVRESDIVGRFGGEEFVVLVPKTTAAEACRIAERLRGGAAALALPAAGGAAGPDPATGETAARDSAAGKPAGITISIGVAALYRHGRDLFELLAAADLALYRAKHTGRDRVCLYDPGAAPEVGH